MCGRFTYTVENFFDFKRVVKKEFYLVTKRSIKVKILREIRVLRLQQKTTLLSMTVVL